MKIEGKAKILELKEGDIIIFTTDKILSMQQRDYISMELKKDFPNNQSVVLTNGDDIKIARPIN